MASTGRRDRFPGVSQRLLSSYASSRCCAPRKVTTYCRLLLCGADRAGFEFARLPHTANVWPRHLHPACRNVRWCGRAAQPSGVLASSGAVAFGIVSLLPVE